MGLIVREMRAWGSVQVEGVEKHDGLQIFAFSDPWRNVIKVEYNGTTGRFLKRRSRCD